MIKQLKSCVIAAVAAVVGGLSATAEVSLPLGYTPLEWIESTGHQLINTKWKASATLRCELDFAPLQTSGNIMFGQGAGQSVANYRFFNYTGTSGAGGYIFDCGGKTSGDPYVRVQNSKPLDNGARYLLKLGIDDANMVYATACNPLTGDVICDPTHQPVGTVPPISDDIYVFGGNLTDSSHTSGQWFNEKMRLYGLKMYDVKSGETERSLVRDFVPCRNEEGVAGVWDKVEGRFYTNCVEDGQRFVGPDDMVARAEWIKSTGSQWINTGVNASINLEAEADFISHEHTGDITIGVDKNDASDWRFFDYSGGVLFDCGGNRAGNTSKTPLTLNTVRYFAQFGVAGGTVYNRVYVKGSDTPYAEYSLTRTATPAADPVGVFGGYMDSKNTVKYAKMTLYSLKLIESGKTVRDYVPCYAANGLYGLMDLANGNAVNLGSGVFEGGPVVETDGEGDATLLLREGSLTANLAANRTLIAKTSPYVADFSAVTSYPALELRKGTLSVQDGQAKTYTVDGTMKVAGGTRLKIDLTASGCDSFTATALDMGELSASAPLFVVVLKAADLTDVAAEYVIASGVNAADGATDCVVARGDIPARFEVRSGNLVMIPLLDVPVTAVWRGGAEDSLADATKWVCSNVLEQVITKPGVLPTVETKVVFPDGCVFNWPKGTSFAHGEIVFPATLGGDCDWTGIDAPITGTIDLNGHKLRLSNLDGTGTLFDKQASVLLTDNDGVEYQKLKFIYGSGSEWIDTEVVPTVNTRIEAAFNTCTRSVNYAMFFGVTSNDSSADGIGLRYMNDSTQMLSAWFCAGASINAATGMWNKDVEVALAKDTLVINGVSYPFTTTGTPYQKSMYLFAARNGNSAWRAQAMCLYSFKMYENGEPVRDFIPVRRTRDNVMGLVDAVNGNKFYGNRGSSEFLSGPTIIDATKAMGTVEIEKGANETLVTGTDTVRLTGSVKLVLSGAGVKNVQDTAIADAADVGVLGGKVVVVHGKHSRPSNGGILHIAPGAVFDCNLPGLPGKDTNVHEDFNKNEPTHGKTIVLEGTLLNAPAGADGANALASHLVVKEGGTIGGGESDHRLDLRVLRASASSRLLIEGGAPLTVRPGNHLAICENAEFALDRIDNYGWVQFEGPMGGTITNNIHCYDGSTFGYFGTVESKLENLVWEIETGTVDFYHSNYAQGGHELAVKAGATVNMAGTGLMTWNGRLSGNGALKGSTFVFGGDQSCWAMRADETGFTEKVNIDGLTHADALRGLTRIELTKACAEPLPTQMALGPAGALTSYEAGDIKVQVCDTEGVTCATGWVTVEDVAGVPTAMLNVKDGVPVLTATWTGAGDAANLADTANWACSNENGVVEKALPKETTIVTIPSGKAFNVPRTTPLAVKEVHFAGALVGDTDLSGLTGALMGVIDLDGHRLTLSGVPDQPTEYAVFVNGNLLGDGGFDLTSVYSGEYGYFNDTAGAGTNDFWWGVQAVSDNLYYSGVAKNPGTFAHESYSAATIGFVQTDGTLYQKVTVPETGDYLLSYFASERQAQARGHTCKALIDDAAEPVATTRVTGSAWTNVSVVVHLEAGEHTLTFQGVRDKDSKGATIDSTTILDNVSLVRADLPTGEIVIDAAEGVAGLAKFRIYDDIVITKAGAGAVTMDDEIIRATTNLAVASGTVRIAHGNLNVRSVGGTIAIASEGTLDLALDAAKNVHDVFGWNEPTHGKTIVLAGTLQNVAQGNGANALVSRIVVQEGARIGGWEAASAASSWARIDMRTLANSANATQWIKGDAVLTALPGNRFICCADTDYALDRIDNYGWVQFEGAQTGGTITNGVHCYDGSTFSYWGVATGMDSLSWVIETGTVEFVHDDRALTQAGDSIEIRTGAALHSVGTVAVTWNGRLSGNGSISGSNFALGGDQSCWAMKADDAGFTEKVDYSAISNANFLVGLKTVEVAYAGDKTVGRRFVIGPAGNLTQAQADAITLTVADADGNAVPGCHLYVNAERMLELNVAMTHVEKATYTGAGTDPNDLSDPANWTCTTADLPVEGGLPMSQTEITIPSDRVFNCTNVDQIAFASVVFPTSIPGDSDWRGLGVAPIDTTIDLQGHKLYVSELKGTGTITDTTELGENLIQDGSFETTTISGHSGRWGYLESGGSVNSYWQSSVLNRAGFTKAGSNSSDYPWTARTVGMISALVQMNGDLYQNVTISEDGSYVLTYSYASRRGQKSHPLEVRVDDKPCCGRTDSADADFAVNKVVLHLTAGTHKIAFVGITTSDVTTILDEVSLRKITAAGELHVVVPEDRTAEWTSVKIEGALKFVKEGAGTYLASNKNGTGIKTWYLGDTWVREGCYKVHPSSSATAGGQNVEYGFYQVQQLGAQGSETTVEKGATFDCGGNYDGYCYTIILNGGTFGNLGTTNTEMKNGTPSRFRLTEDSSVAAPLNTQLGDTDLGGHTLTITNDPACSFYLRGPVENGTLVSHGGRFRPYGGDWDMSDVDLVLDSKMSCYDQTVTFRNLTVTYPNEEPNPASPFGHGGKFFCVRGTYTPVSDQIWRFKLLNGATIDLSKRTTPLDIEPDANGLFFDDNAETIYVSAAGRQLRSSEPVLKWKTKPNVRFVATRDSRCGFEARSDGLYPVKGLLIVVR